MASQKDRKNGGPVSVLGQLARNPNYLLSGLIAGNVSLYVTSFSRNYEKVFSPQPINMSPIGFRIFLY